MNFEGIRIAAKKNEMFSPLLSVCYEMEQQGYAVKVEGLEIDPADLDTDMFDELENATNVFEFELLKQNTSCEKFKLLFIGDEVFRVEGWELLSYMLYNWIKKLIEDVGFLAVIRSTEFKASVLEFNVCLRS